MLDRMRSQKPYAIGFSCSSSCTRAILVVLKGLLMLALASSMVRGTYVIHGKVVANAVLPAVRT